MLRFRKAIEDTYDSVTAEYYESTEYRELSDQADSLYDQLRQQPDNWKDLLEEYRQSMMDLSASMACNSYVLGVYAGMAELQEFNKITK